jgi:hypothetical protein
MDTGIPKIPGLPLRELNRYVDPERRTFEVF